MAADTDVETDLSFRIRRAAEWQAAMDSHAWLDLFASVTEARDGVVKDLLSGVSNRYGERGYDEQRAMIHAFNAVLKMPDAVRVDAERAITTLRRYEAMNSTGRKQ